DPLLDSPHDPGAVQPAGQRPRQRARLLIVVLVALAALPIALYGTLWIYRFALSLLGPFAPLAVVGGVTLVAAILGPWLLSRYRRPLQSALRGAERLLWTLAHATGLPQWLDARFPRFSTFLRARFAPGSATGLGLTIGLSVGFAVAFAALVNVVE